MEVSALLHNGPKKIVIPPQSQQIEQRRVIGPMRERTIFIQTNFPKNTEKHIDYSGAYTPNIISNRTYASMNPSDQSYKADQMEENKEWENCVSRISKHVDDVLISQQNSIDEKLHNIEDHAEKAKELQESVEQRLKELKRLLKKKRIAQTPQIMLPSTQLLKPKARVAQTPDIFSHLRFNFEFE